MTSSNPEIHRTKILTERLRRANQQFRLIFDKAAIGIALTDPDGLMLKTNREFQRMLGYSARELKGRSFADISHPDDVARNLAVRTEALKTKRDVYQLEKRYIRKDGSTIWAHLKVTVARNAAGEPDFLVGMVQDTSDRVKAAEDAARRSAEVAQARELAKLKDHFLSLISHEMKTPLSVILGYSELLQDRCPRLLRGRCPETELLDGIRLASNRLVDRIDHILDYSALIGGSLTLYRTEINIHEVATAACHAVNSEVERRGVKVQFQIAQDLPPVLADSRRLTQMVAELLSNAVRATPAGGQVGIHASYGWEGVKVEIWDTGQGIPEEQRDRIWTPFDQGDYGDSAHRIGLGLGLAIVKGLATLHGGEVRLDSTSGNGSCFSLLLPVLDQPVSPRQRFSAGQMI